MHATWSRSTFKNGRFFYEWDGMKFPGYWVSMDACKVVLQKSTFDETELDPATQWKQAWQNQDEKKQAKGYVELSDALVSAATLLARAAGRALTPDRPRPGRSVRACLAVPTLRNPISCAVAWLHRQLSSDVRRPNMTKKRL
jgi:hypothetical protein